VSNKIEIPCIDCVVLGTCMSKLNTIQYSNDPFIKITAMSELMVKCSHFSEYVRSVSVEEGIEEGTV
jgi:hypothetical protein